MANEGLPVVGAAIREARQARGLTQSELASRAGISARFVADLEAGANFSVDTLRKVASALGGLVLPLGHDVTVTVSAPAPSDDAAKPNGRSTRRKHRKHPVSAPDAVRREIGRLIKTRRKSRNWNQAKLAVEAGLSRTWVSSIESGLPASDAVLLRLLRLLEVDRPETIVAGVASAACAVSLSVNGVTWPSTKTVADLEGAVEDLRTLFESIQSRGFIRFADEYRDAIVTTIASLQMWVDVLSNPGNADVVATSPAFMESSFDLIWAGYTVTRRGLQELMTATERAWEITSRAKGTPQALPPWIDAPASE